MSLIQLVYASSAIPHQPAEQIRDIVQKANKRNNERGVTGFLCSDNHYFLQCIEGQRDKINQLYLNISRDRRHHSLEILSYQYIDTPAFPIWGMGALLHIDKHLDLTAQYNESDGFNPYTLSPENSLKLLIDLAAYRGINAHQT